MLKNLINKEKQSANEKAKEVLTLELREIQEISERLFKRMDEKTRTLRDLEKQVDQRIAVLTKLLTRTERLQLNTFELSGSRNHEVHALAKKGLKTDEIAGILDMPKGEVELILSLGRQ